MDKFSKITSSIGKYLKEIRTEFPDIKTIQEGFPNDITSFEKKVPFVIYSFVRPLLSEFHIGENYRIKKGVWEINIFTAQANLNDAGNHQYLRNVLEYIINMLEKKAIPIYDNGKEVEALMAKITFSSPIILPTGTFAEKYRAVINFELEFEVEDE